MTGRLTVADVWKHVQRDTRVAMVDASERGWCERGWFGDTDRVEAPRAKTDAEYMAEAMAEVDAILAGSSS